MRSPISAFAALVCAPLFVCACGPQDDVGDEAIAFASTQQPLVGGERTTGEPATVLIWAIGSDNRQASCTGTVVAPHLIVTAAHCVHPSVLEPMSIRSPTFWVFFGDDAGSAAQQREPGAVVRAQEVITHPDFEMAPLQAPRHDLAVVVMKDAMSVTPVPLNRTPLPRGAIGTPVRVLGFGREVANEPKSNGTRKWGVATISSLDDSTFGWGAQGSVFGCEGDSGGPTMISRQGVISLAGVHSWHRSRSCAVETIDARVDVDFAGFFEPMITRFDADSVPPSDGVALAADAGETAARAATFAGAGAGCSFSRVPIRGESPLAFALVLVGSIAGVGRRRLRHRQP